MTPYQAEELENIRRVAERGKASAEPKSFPEHRFYYEGNKHFLDIFVHILDTVERIKNDKADL